LTGRLKKVIAQNLKGYRKMRDLTQEDIAKRARMNPNTISRLERGDKDVGFSLGTLEKLSDALGIEPYILLIPESYRKNYRLVSN